MARFSKIHWISQHASLTSEQQRQACEQLLLRFSKLARMFDLLKHTTLVLDSSAAIDLMSDETCRMLECEHAIVHLVDRDRVFVRPQTLRHPRLQLKRVATENAAAQRALQNATGMCRNMARFHSTIQYEVLDIFSYSMRVSVIRSRFRYEFPDRARNGRERGAGRHHVARRRRIGPGLV